MGRGYNKVMMIKRKFWRSPLLWGLVIVLGGCSNYIDGEKVESAISTGLQKQTGLEIKTVTCPEKEPIETDATFQCDVTVSDGQTFKADVTQQDDEGNIVWNAQAGLNTLKGFIDNDLLAKQISDGILAQTEIEVETDCGGLFRIATKGETFTCMATDAQNNTSEVRVEAQDDEGNVAWEL